jgi:hypothetical protein
LFTGAKVPSAKPLVYQAAIISRPKLFFLPHPERARLLSSLVIGASCLKDETLLKTSVLI